MNIRDEMRKFIKQNPSLFPQMKRSNFFQKRFIKYASVGVINTLIDFSIFTFLVAIGTNTIISNSISFIIGATNSYILNRLFTFNIKDRHITKNDAIRFVYFLMTSLCMLAISNISIFFISKILNVLISKAISILVVLFLGYFVNSKLVFSNK